MRVMTKAPRPQGVAEHDDAAGIPGGGVNRRNGTTERGLDSEDAEEIWRSARTFYIFRLSGTGDIEIRVTESDDVIERFRGCLPRQKVLQASREALAQEALEVG